MSTKKSVAKKTVARKGKPQGSATTASILGGISADPAKTNGKIKIKREWESYNRNLLDLHERLLTQMSGLAKESATEMESYSLHMGDSGTDNFDRDFALSLLSSDQDAVYEIEEALKRIERGTFGTCELTNKPIPKARLEAIPWTRFTVDAQAQLERDGAIKHKRLGQLGSLETSAGPDTEEDDEPDEKPSKDKEKE